MNRRKEREDFQIEVVNPHHRNRKMGHGGGIVRKFWNYSYNRTRGNEMEEESKTVLGRRLTVQLRTYPIGEKCGIWVQG